MKRLFITVFSVFVTIKTYEIMPTKKVSIEIVRISPLTKYIFAATDEHDNTEIGITVLIKSIKFLRANKISILPTKKQ